MTELYIVQVRTVNNTLEIYWYLNKYAMSLHVAYTICKITKAAVV